jgi:hypothetical protein
MADNWLMWIAWGMLIVLMASLSGAGAEEDGVPPSRLRQLFVLPGRSFWRLRNWVYEQPWAAVVATGLLFLCITVVVLTSVLRYSAGLHSFATPSVASRQLYVSVLGPYPDLAIDIALIDTRHGVTSHMVRLWLPIWAVGLLIYLLVMLTPLETIQRAKATIWRLFRSGRQAPD